ERNAGHHRWPVGQTGGEGVAACAARAAGRKLRHAGAVRRRAGPRPLSRAGHLRSAEQQDDDIGRGVRSPMRRFALIAIIAVIAHVAYGESATVRVQESITIEIPGATAAYAVDPSIADVVAAAGGRVSITGR